MDDCGVVVLLNESANHAQRRKPEVFKGTSFGGGVQEGVEEEGDVSYVDNKLNDLHEESQIRTYLRGRVGGFPGATQHTAKAREHCILGLRYERSSSEEKADDRQSRSPATMQP